MKYKFLHRPISLRKCKKMYCQKIFRLPFKSKSPRGTREHIVFSGVLTIQIWLVSNGICIYLKYEDIPDGFQDYVESKMNAFGISIFRKPSGVMHNTRSAPSFSHIVMFFE